MIWGGSCIFMVMFVTTGDMLGLVGSYMSLCHRSACMYLVLRVVIYLRSCFIFNWLWGIFHWRRIGRHVIYLLFTCVEFVYGCSLIS